MKRQIYLIVDNVRSAHNVGSLLRTADGLGVGEVFLCGYTPYPSTQLDDRPPYLADKINRQIKKTALGAEVNQKWSHHSNTLDVIKSLSRKHVEIVAIEQDKHSITLNTFKPHHDVALVLGSETDGISRETLAQCDRIAEIPMLGVKESFNVAVTAGMALFYLRHMI